MQARRLENEIDIKLAAFGKQCSRYEYGGGSLGSETGISMASNLSMASVEIERLIEQLQGINDDIALLSQQQASDVQRHHVLLRHRDILRDFAQEYKRLNSIAISERNRADLLGSSQGMAASGINSQPGNAKGLLLRERSTLDRSHSAIDTVVAQAHGVSSGLGQQRQMFDSIDTRLAMLGTKFPVMNSVLNAIRRKKNRDNVILMGVAAFCIVVMLLYWINK